MFHPAPRPLYLREIDPVHIVQGAGWAPGSVWVWKVSPTTGIGSPDVASSCTVYAIPVCTRISWEVSVQGINDLTTSKTASEISVLRPSSCRVSRQDVGANLKDVLGYASRKNTNKQQKSYLPG